MAGFIPAIHVLLVVKTWTPGIADKCSSLRKADYYGRA